MVTRLITLAFLCVFASCGFRYEQATLKNGKKIWVRDYSNPETEERYRVRHIFKSAHMSKTFYPYNGSITIGGTEHCTFIQFDTDRVYLTEKTATYKEIFTSGLVSAQTLYCLLDSACQPQPWRYYIDSSGNRVQPNYCEWTGHTLLVRAELLPLNSYAKSKRRFKVWVSPPLNHVSHVFFLELTNEQANRHTTWPDFIKGAKTTVLKNGWIEI